MKFYHIKCLLHNIYCKHGIDEEYGVVVRKVKKQSPANRSDIQPGDVITKIGRDKITSTDDYQSLVKQYEQGDSILLLVKRNGASRFVALEI